jgi:phage-related baseplate assembly protein
VSQISFADLDFATVESSVLTAYERIAETTLYPGDPVRLFLESLAYALAVQNQVIDLAGKQNLLAFARGNHLDYIGMMVGTPRLGKSSAVCTQRFVLPDPLTFDVDVPAGTRVTTGDGAIIFVLEAALSIQAGETEAEGRVIALEPGAGSNGLVPGQINRIIDPLPYIATTENTSATFLGADVESDARYRARIQEAPERFTCAGPLGSYRALAMSVHQDIADVGVWSPKPGTVDVRPVMTGGELPSEDVLSAVREKLSADDVRPLTDTVIVAAPEVVEYDLDVDWSLSKGNAPLSDTIRNSVAEAVERYRLWQRSVPGRDINPTRLISLMEQAGARRVVVRGPEYKTLEARQIAREMSVAVNYIGVEDD